MPQPVQGSARRALVISAGLLRLVALPGAPLSLTSMLESGPATQLTRPQGPHRRSRRPQPEAKKSEFLFGPAINDVQGKGRVLATQVELMDDGTLSLQWKASAVNSGWGSRRRAWTGT